MNDTINHPDHYQGHGIECIDAIRAQLGYHGFLSYCQGNAVKYLWRWHKKGGTEDLRKAKAYIDFMLDSA